MEQHFLYLDMDPELWTQPLQHFGNKEYYLHFLLIVVWCFSHFCGCVLYLDMDPEPSTHPLTSCQQRVSLLVLGYFFLILWPLFSWFLYLDIDPGSWTQPLQLNMAPGSNTIFHLFFPNFLVIFHHFTGVFLFKVKCSRGVERWINQWINENFA